MYRSKRRVIGIAAVLVAVAALPTRAWTQTLGALGRWEQTVEFGVDSDREQIIDPFRRIGFDRTRTDQKVGVRGRLPILDPRLVTTAVSLDFGLFQDRLDYAGIKTPIDGQLLGYDISASVLPEKPFLLTLFANRTRGTVSREFAGTSDVLSEHRGVSVSIRRLRLPSTLMLRSERLEEVSHYGDLSGRRAESRNIFSWDGHRTWRTQDLGVRYELIDLEDRVFSALTNRSQTLGLQHRLEFGAARTKAITSNFVYLSREGAFSSTLLSADEGLTLRHRRSLSSSYHYSFFDYSALGGRSLTHTGLTTLQHQWYESLRTNVSLRYSTSEFLTGFEHRWTARVDPNYTKRLPWGGTLNAGLAGSYELQTDRLGSGDIPIAQERHTVQLGVPFRLERPRPDLASIIVSDAAGAVVYQEGPDYLIRVFGDFVEITALPAGRIRDGQIVSIDYRAAAAPLIKFSTTGVRARVGADFGWIYPFAGYERARQDLIAGIDDNFLDDLGIRNAGVQLRWERPKLRASFVQEYRSQTSRRLTFDTFQLGQTITYTPTPILTFSFGLTEDISEFSLPQSRRTRSGLGRSSVGWQPPFPGLFIDAFDQVRLWRDSLAAGETFSDNGVRVTWSLGKIAIQTFFGFDVRQRDGTETRALRTSVRVVRRFGGTG